MTKEIGFRAPEPLREWRFDIGKRSGVIEEKITPNGFHRYYWIADDGGFTIGILDDDHSYSNEEVEAKLRARLEEPGLAAHSE